VHDLVSDLLKALRRELLHRESQVMNRRGGLECASLTSVTRVTSTTSFATW
jgi:hypothetical protein